MSRPPGRAGVVAAPGSEALGRLLADRLGVEFTISKMRHFPDGETYLRLGPGRVRQTAVVLAALDRPDGKIPCLLFLADLVRELGARKLVLVAPYLPYMRQDKRFRPGEAVTSRSFAQLLSRYFDRLITVDPHLHRFESLSELYTIPAQVVHAAPLLAQWIQGQVERPLLVGPDSESEQWVAEVARLAGAPYIVLEKIRHGDRDVEVTVPQPKRWAGYRPVLVDDIISSAHTMMETVAHLRRAGLSPPDCLGVHGVFADGAYEALRAAGVRHIVTTNTIQHESSAIDLSESLARSLDACLSADAGLG